MASLLQTDREFAQMAREIGTGKAFIAFADDDVIKMNENAAPVFGKQALQELYGNLPDEAPLIWEPIKAEVSAAGDMGYTFGAWKWTYAIDELADTIFTGVYVTIWKKQKDGSWKYILDGGNITPPPAEWPQAKP